MSQYRLNLFIQHEHAKRLDRLSRQAERLEREVPQLNVWKRLAEGLSLAGANAGEERTAQQTPEPLSSASSRMTGNATSCCG
ncbi:TPA: hypothetical protein ACP327_006388 [Pseudomonas aeruginosa]